MEYNAHHAITEINKWLFKNNFKSEVKLLNNWIIIVDYLEIIELFKQNYRENTKTLADPVSGEVINVPYKSGKMSIINEAGFIKIIISK